MLCRIGGSRLFISQHVAFAPARQDQRFVMPLVDLVAQVPNIDIDHVGRVLVVFVVQMFPDHGAGDDLAAMGRQNSRISNSRGVRWTERPARLTACVTVSISRSCTYR